MPTAATRPNQNPEQKARDRIDAQLRAAGWANGRSMEAIVADLNRTLSGWFGWFGYFKHAKASELSGIDEWIRMRFRKRRETCLGPGGPGGGFRKSGNIEHRTSNVDVDVEGEGEGEGEGEEDE